MSEQDGSPLGDFECKMKVSMETDKISIIREYARCRLNLEERKKRKGLGVEEIDKIDEQLKLLRNEFLGWLEKSNAPIRLKEEVRDLAVECSVEADNLEDVEELLVETKECTTADVVIIDRHVLGDEDSIKLLDLCEEKDQKHDGECVLRLPEGPAEVVSGKCVVEDSIAIVDLSDHSLVSKDLAYILVETQAVPKKAEFFEQTKTFEVKNELSEMDSNCYCLEEGATVPEDSISLNLIGTNENPASKMSNADDANLFDNQDLRGNFRFINDEDDDDCAASSQKGCSFFGFNLFCF